MDTFYNNILQGLVLVLVFTLIQERALTTLFSWRYFKIFLDNRGFKIPINIALSIYICNVTSFDLITYLGGTPSNIGMFLTALLISGGSKGLNDWAVKVLNIKDNLKK